MPWRKPGLRTALNAAFVLALAALAALSVLRSRAPAPADSSFAGETMGTTYSVELSGSPLSRRDLSRLRGEVEARLAEIDRQMSLYRADSEICLFNRSGAAQPMEVSPGFARAVGFALDLARRSDGAFDPCLGPLISLWGFGPGGPRSKPPTDEEVARARESSGYQHLSFGPENRLQKDIPGLQLDLGAVAQGFGVDELAAAVEQFGVTDYLVELGGETFARGLNARGETWRIGVQRPDLEALPGQALVGVIQTSGLAVSTSGDYQNFFRAADGRVYCHILDPRTGRPVEHNLASVTVVAPDCLTADGLATALFVLGAEEGLKVLASYPAAEALFVGRKPDGGYETIMSPGFGAATAYEPAGNE